MGDWTQGPWETEDRETRIVILADGFHDEIASLDTGSFADRVDADALDAVIAEQTANAKLIAAAPDLYEALRELDPANGHRTDCNERKCGECSTCRARAALAKAEGRSRMTARRSSPRSSGRGTTARRAP